MRRRHRPRRRFELREYQLQPIASHVRGHLVVQGARQAGACDRRGNRGIGGVHRQARMHRHGDLAGTDPEFPGVLRHQAVEGDDVVLRKIRQLLRAAALVQIVRAAAL